jgi:hypothetical protein
MTGSPIALFLSCLLWMAVAALTGWRFALWCAVLSYVLCLFAFAFPSVLTEPE